MGTGYSSTLENMVWNAAHPVVLLRRGWEFAHSMKLAIVLMLLCALAAVPGTLVPAVKTEQFYRETFGPRVLSLARAAGLLDVYRSPPFLLLLGLLAANIALCSWRRFRTRSAHATRQRWPLIWSDLLLHASIILVLAGGAGRAVWGFVGTEYLVVGVPTTTVYDWSSQGDVQLGFALLAKERVDEYYPLLLKVGIRDAAGKKVALLEVGEGRAAEIPGATLKLSLFSYDAAAATVRIRAELDGRSEIATLVVREGSPPAPVGGGYTAALVAWRRELKNVRARVAVLDGEREVQQQWLSTNERLSFRGASVFLTGWGRDESGNLNVGIQVSRDPAAPLFWAGCILLSVASASFFLLRHRRGHSG